MLKQLKLGKLTLLHWALVYVVSFTFATLKWEFLAIPSSAPGKFKVSQS